MNPEPHTTLSFLTDAPRHLFFTGKGGVGKTSLACASALALADTGKRVLLVSTDPASNLQHVFETDIGEREPTPVPGTENLFALNLDPESAAQTYRDRVVGPVRGVLPDATVREMEEQLSGACTTEIAAFDEFTTLLTDPSTTEGFDHVVFDTAPTGHTLRLLSLPNAWSGFLDTNTSGASCLGPLAGLEKQRQQYKAAVDALADGAATTLVLVSRPHRSALGEAARTSAELAGLGICNQRLAVNGLIPAEGITDDPLAQAMLARDKAALSTLPHSLQQLPMDRIPLQAHNLIGLDHLRSLLQEKPQSSANGTDGRAGSPSTPRVGSVLRTDRKKEAFALAMPLATLIDELEQDGHGLIMVMGKGGVGKTTLAAAVAVELARRGHEVNLTTTDPAAHVTETVASEVARLSVSRIDPAAETERYRQHVLETKGKDLDDAGRKLLEEDLRSPCTEEIAVFQAFSKAIREASRRFVVMDTAPTGHTLLLLDATGAYHRDITRHQVEGAGGVVTPMMRLQDPKQTKMLLVTLPETTPVLEAASLQEDLRRAGIEPWAWIINASLAAAGPTEPLLLARARAEVQQIEKVRRELAQRTALVPWLAKEPTGPENLAKLFVLAGEVAKP